MNDPKKPRSAFMVFFAPGPDAYDHHRSNRILFVSIVFGVAFAIGFGFLMYYLGVGGKLHGISATG